jgi:hypothetical protein
MYLLALQDIWTKTKTLVLAGMAGVWGILAPIHVLIYCVFFLIGADFAAGIWKAIKSKESITSRRMRETVGKLAGYMLALLACFAVDKILGLNDISIARLTAGGLAFVELKSIAENLTVILGFDPLAAVIEKLKPKPKDPQS